MGPSVPADGDRMAAMIVSAINQDTSNAHVTHVGERDVLWAAGHAHDLADLTDREAVRTRKSGSRCAHDGRKEGHKR
jgi:hypothetical protein